MPRLDNSDYIVISFYGLEYSDGDPGKTSAVDLCNDCACAWLDAELFIEHPDYDDWAFAKNAYHCLGCRRQLTEAEDGWSEDD